MTKTTVYCWEDPKRPNPYKGRRIRKSDDERLVRGIKAGRTPLERAALYGHLMARNGASDVNAKAAHWLYSKEGVDLNFKSAEERARFTRAYADAVWGQEADYER